MYLRDIPESILFNKQTTLDNVLEYKWGVDIGTTSLKGYRMSASSFKYPGSKPQYLPIEKAVQTDLWKLSKHPSEHGFSGSYLEDAEISIDYNLNLIKITGTIPGISDEIIDYVKVFAFMHDYESGNTSDEILVDLNSEY